MAERGVARLNDSLIETPRTLDHSAAAGKTSAAIKSGLSVPKLTFNRTRWLMTDPHEKPASAVVAILGPPGSPPGWNVSAAESL